MNNPVPYINLGRAARRQELAEGTSVKPRQANGGTGERAAAFYQFSKLWR